MKNWFVHPDGRLRIGLLSLLAFGLILALAEVAFEVKKATDVEVVKVRHVFEESDAQEPPQEPPQEVVPPEPTPEPESEPEVAQKTVEPEEEPDPPAVVAAQLEMAPPKAVEPQEVVAPVDVSPAPQTEPAPPKANEMEPLLALLGEKKVAKPEDSGRRDFEISDALRQLANSPAETAVVPQSQAVEESSAQKPPRQTSLEGVVVTESGVELETEEYNEMFKSWRNAGNVEHGQKQLSFRVQNLRKNYQLLQMKPVVVRTGRYFDLLSGAPLPERVLQEYSSLQLVVEKPWQEWQPELKQLGLRTSDDFNVRYLLYGSIDRAMQARVNRAFECVAGRGLVPPSTAPAEVEIIGKVFQISRTGGGRFGVFVPRTLNFEGGEPIPVPGQCFAASLDVQLLMSAGVL